MPEGCGKVLYDGPHTNQEPTLCCIHAQALQHRILHFTDKQKISSRLEAQKGIRNRRSFNLKRRLLVSTLKKTAMRGKSEPKAPKKQK
jgi:hypothetical protein